MSCPICSKPSEAKFTPFCSRRCKLIDLGQWANEKYRIAGQDTPNQAQLDDEQQVQLNGDQDVALAVLAGDDHP